MTTKLVPARYFAAKDTVDMCWYVWMEDDEQYLSTIQKCKTRESCEKAAARWQKKENASVMKENKKRGFA